MALSKEEINIMYTRNIQFIDYKYLIRKPISEIKFVLMSLKEQRKELTI